MTRVGAPDEWFHGVDKTKYAEGRKISLFPFDRIELRRSEIVAKNQNFPGKILSNSNLLFKGSYSYEKISFTYHTIPYYSSSHHTFRYMLMLVK